MDASLCICPTSGSAFVQPSAVYLPAHDTAGHRSTHATCMGMQQAFGRGGGLACATMSLLSLTPYALPQNFDWRDLLGQNKAQLVRTSAMLHAHIALASTLPCLLCSTVNAAEPGEGPPLALIGV
jgi:hypothetical protein